VSTDKTAKAEKKRNSKCNHKKHKGGRAKQFALRWNRGKAESRYDLPIRTGAGDGNYIASVPIYAPTSIASPVPVSVAVTATTAGS